MFLTVLTVLTAGRVLIFKMFPGEHFEDFDRSRPRAGRFDPRVRPSLGVASPNDDDEPGWSRRGSSSSPRTGRLAQISLSVVIYLDWF